MIDTAGLATLHDLEEALERLRAGVPALVLARPGKDPRIVTPADINDLRQELLALSRFDVNRVLRGL